MQEDELWITSSSGTTILAAIISIVVSSITAFWAIHAANKRQDKDHELVKNNHESDAQRQEIEYRENVARDDLRRQRDAVSDYVNGVYSELKDASNKLNKLSSTMDCENFDSVFYDWTHCLRDFYSSVGILSSLCKFNIMDQHVKFYIEEVQFIVLKERLNAWKKCEARIENYRPIAWK